MALLRKFEHPELYRGGIVSIGNFDGVHSGHRQVIGRLAAEAARHNAPAVVLTFEPHPLALLRPHQAPASLTTIEQKSELLHAAGADCVIAYPTDLALLELTPEQFFGRIVISELRAKGVLEGPNFCFGKDRKGDVATLHQLCEREGVELEILEAVGGERMVSSSAIRALLTAGRMDDAVALLGHAYRVQGRVVAGAGRGRTIGIPTVNLSGIVTLIPGDGVYAGTVTVDGVSHRAAVNIGANPTFGEDACKVEAHLLDFAGDLYGTLISLDLFHRIRSTMRFANVDELRMQVAMDIKEVRATDFQNGPLRA